MFDTQYYTRLDNKIRTILLLSNHVSYWVQNIPITLSEGPCNFAETAQNTDETLV